MSRVRSDVFIFIFIILTCVILFFYHMHKCETLSHGVKKNNK